MRVDCLFRVSSASAESLFLFLLGDDSFTSSSLYSSVLSSMTGGCSSSSSPTSLFELKSINCVRVCCLYKDIGFGWADGGMVDEEVGAASRRCRSRGCDLYTLSGGGCVDVVVVFDFAARRGMTACCNTAAPLDIASQLIWIQVQVSR